MKRPRGLGIWIVYAPGSGTDAERARAVVDRAASHGLSTLFVKIADGVNDHATSGGVKKPSYHPFVRALVPVAAAAGIDVISWAFVYDNPEAGRKQVEWSKALGCAGHVFDVEVEGQDGSAPYANNPARAHDLMIGARTAANEDFWLALTSYYNRRYHASTPWEALLNWCDGHCPQVYDAQHIEMCVGIAYEDFGGPGWPEISPLWGNISGAVTGAQIQEFSRVSRAHGATNASVWEWESLTADAWAMLKTIAPEWKAEEPPMASGKDSVHPDTFERLAACGVKSEGIIQGVATVDSQPGHPSAGTHDAVGRINGRRFGHSVDVTPDVSRGGLAFSRANFDALVALGFAPFARIGWADGDHWHIVDCSRPVADGGGRPDHKDVVNGQVTEWVNYGDGLVGNDPMPLAWRPTAAQTTLIRQVIKSGDAPTAADPAAPDEWARESWDLAKANGVISSSLPRDPATVQLVVVVVHRLWKMVLKMFQLKGA